MIPCLRDSVTPCPHGCCRAQEEPALELGAVNDLEAHLGEESLFDEGSRAGDEAAERGRPEAAGEQAVGPAGEGAGVGVRRASPAPDTGVLPHHKWHPHTVKVTRFRGVERGGVSPVALGGTGGGG